MTTATRRTPRISGARVAQEMLMEGLTSFTRIAAAASGSDIVRWRSGHRHVFAIIHPDYIEHVLRQHADRDHKSVEYQLVSAVLGRSLFTDDGESWRRHRMMLNPLMGRRHLNGVVDLMIDPIAEYVTALEARGDRFEIEMVGDMTELTLDVVGAALFGRGLGSVAKKIGSAVTTGLRLGGDRRADHDRRRAAGVVGQGLRRDRPPRAAAAVAAGSGAADDEDDRRPRTSRCCRGPAPASKRHSGSSPRSG